MTAALSLVACVVLAGVLWRRWRLSTLAAWAEKDAKALAGPHPAMPDAKFGRKFSSPAMGAKYDESKVARWQQTQNRQAAYRRAKSRKAQDRVKPATVATPFRKVK